MKIIITTMSAQGHILHRTVEADVTGEWAVHGTENEPDDRPWTVTHVPTGLVAYRLRSKAGAAKLAALLVDRVPTLDYSWNGKGVPGPADFDNVHINAVIAAIDEVTL